MEGYTTQLMVLKYLLPQHIFVDIDIVIFATGYKHTDFLTEVGINFKSDFLYNYVLPLSVYDINNTKGHS